MPLNSRQPSDAWPCGRRPSGHSKGRRARAHVWDRALNSVSNHGRGFQTSLACLLDFKRLLAVSVSTMPTGSASGRTPACRGAGPLPVRSASHCHLHLATFRVFYHGRSDPDPPRPRQSLAPASRRRKQCLPSLTQEGQHRRKPGDLASRCCRRHILVGKSPGPCQSAGLTGSFQATPGCICERQSGADEELGTRQQKRCEVVSVLCPSPFGIRKSSWQSSRGRCHPLYLSQWLR